MTRQRAGRTQAPRSSAPSTTRERRRRRQGFRWPDPIAPEPEAAKLLEWEAEGRCQATDGCWVAQEGICPHGYPSWALWLGML
jgi:hypothetical protein